MRGAREWLPASDAKTLFGVERTVSFDGYTMLTRVAPVSVRRWRWWLGYKLYAIVYWLLRGHA